jgi:hypothetical protein
VIRRTTPKRTPKRIRAKSMSRARRRAGLTRRQVDAIASGAWTIGPDGWLVRA